MTGLKLFGRIAGDATDSNYVKLKRSFSRRRRRSASLTSLEPPPVPEKPQASGAPLVAYADAPALALCSSSTASLVTSSPPSTLFDAYPSTAESVTTEEDSELAPKMPGRVSCFCGRSAEPDSIYCSVRCGRADALRALCSAAPAQTHYRRTCFEEVRQSEIEQQLRLAQQKPAPRAPPTLKKKNTKLTLDMLRQIGSAAEGRRISPDVSRAPRVARPAPRANTSPYKANFDINNESTVTLKPGGYETAASVITTSRSSSCSVGSDSSAGSVASTSSASPSSTSSHYPQSTYYPAVDATPTLLASPIFQPAFEFDAYSSYSYDPDVLESLGHLDLDDIDQQQMLLDALNLDRNRESPERNTGPLLDILQSLNACTTLNEQEAFINSLDPPHQQVFLDHLSETNSL